MLGGVKKFSTSVLYQLPFVNIDHSSRLLGSPATKMVGTLSLSLPTTFFNSSLILDEVFVVPMATSPSSGSESSRGHWGSEKVGDMTIKPVILPQFLLKAASLTRFQPSLPRPSTGLSPPPNRQE